MPLNPAPEDVVAAVARRLTAAESVLFVTGAGISADSGLPTYRGVGGLYEDRLTSDGIAVEDALSGATLATNPTLCWRYIQEIERACRGAGPNRAHEVIAQMDNVLPRVWTLTQNVDGFHREAGSKNVIEIHGNIHDLLCTSCGDSQRVKDYEDLPELPRCQTCEGVLRPDVVLFGELLPAAKYAELQTQVQRGFDLVFSVGTTSVFPYIAWPVMEASARGVPTVEINPGTTDVSQIVDYRLEERAAVALNAVWNAWQSP